MTSFLLGAVATTPYRLLLVVHIVAVVCGFGPTLLYGRLSREARKHPGDVGGSIARISPLVDRRISLPAFAVAVLAGIGLVAESDGLWKFEQSWVSAAFAVVIALVLVGAFVLSPALKRLQLAVEQGPEGEAAARAANASIGAATGMFHLGMVVLLVLMVWKPGV